MAAEVETMFYTGRKAPWHGLGTSVSEASTSESALELAGLNWRVIQKDIMTNDGIPVLGFKANVLYLIRRILSSLRQCVVCSFLINLLNSSL